MSERNGTWLKILLALIPLALVGLVGYGNLRSDVTHNSVAIDSKASRETVNVQYEAILAQLKQINDRLDRLEGGRGR